jgi:tRNA(Leu) C34 or U34 (ribose-2'-O)-methylase TrmL
MGNSIEKAVLGKKAPPVGVVPSIALINPKHAHNVARAIRLASCYGLKQVWWTGNRVSLTPKKGQRLPREERMRGYQDVEMIHFDNLFDQFSNVVPVAIEVRKDSESLFDFEHPKNALYVFGPEDGSIPSWALPFCHRFVVIPSRHCLNLSTAVSTVLYDREIKRYWNGEIETVTPGEFENRGIQQEVPVY